MMNLSTLKDTPPWDWPEGTGQKLLDILQDNRATESDLLIATELAGDLTIIDDELADALVSVLKRANRHQLETARCRRRRLNSRRDYCQPTILTKHPRRVSTGVVDSWCWEFAKAWLRVQLERKRR